MDEIVRSIYRNADLMYLSSFVIGFAVGFFTNNKVLGGAIPWTAFLVLTLYMEYFVPYSGGGASMWPIAVLFAGTACFLLGFAGQIYSIQIKKLVLKFRTKN